MGFAENIIREELQVLQSLPNNACNCNRAINRHRKDKKAPSSEQSGSALLSKGVQADTLLNNQKGCHNSLKWLKIAYSNDNYHFMSNYKVYKSFFDQQSYNICQEFRDSQRGTGDLTDISTVNDSQVLKQMVEQMYSDIDADVERTFTDMEFFQKESTKSSLRRILIALTNYEQTVGYVQGMNFIAAALLYHAGEVAAFWLMCALIDKYQLKDILQPGLPGLNHHNEIIQQRVSEELPDLHRHLQANFVSVPLLTTDWVIGLFMNCLPLELTASFLDNFFKEGWKAFYDLAIGILRYHEEQLLLLSDGSEIISTIK